MLSDMWTNIALGWAGIAALIGLAASGIFVVIGWLQNRKDTVDEKEHAEADRLIGLLQKTVDQLERDMKKISDEFVEAKKDLVRINQENGIITKILQGRDGSTEKYYTAGYGAMEKVHETHELVMAMAESINRLCIALESK